MQPVQLTGKVSRKWIQGNRIRFALVEPLPVNPATLNALAKLVGGCVDTSNGCHLLLNRATYLDDLKTIRLTLT